MLSDRLLSALCWVAILSSPAPVLPADLEAAKARRSDAAIVRRWMTGMTLREEIAQLIFIPFNGVPLSSKSPEFEHLVRLVHDMKVGGLLLVNVANGQIVSRADPFALGSVLNRLQKRAHVPLLVGADFERGASMRVAGTPIYPHAMAFAATGDPSLVWQEGRATAREARALGIHWLFYPVADVNTNPDNPVINIRSFGESPVTVSTFVRSFIEGAHSDPHSQLLTTAKHFPGHGDTAIDTHLSVATVLGSAERLNDVELPPFRAAIAGGVDAIMTGHIAVPALAPNGAPATFSHEILTDLLRDQLEFHGLVITDALEMGAVRSGSDDNAVRALQAGSDVLLEPPNPIAAINSVVKAVAKGTILRARIRESVKRVLTAKVKVGLAMNRMVDLDQISEVLDDPVSIRLAQDVANRAITLIRNNDQEIPFNDKDNKRICFAILMESETDAAGLTLEREVRRRIPGAPIAVLNPSMSLEAAYALIEALPSCEHYVAGVLASAGAFSSTALPEPSKAAIARILEKGKPVTIVALGSPYILRDYPDVAAMLATFSNTSTAATGAVRALLGEIPIRGKLPVSIPGIAEVGDGIQLEPLPRN
jgi:beta-N-acetylhexosaminidase